MVKSISLKGIRPEKWISRYSLHQLLLSCTEAAKRVTDSIFVSVRISYYCILMHVEAFVFPREK